MTRVEVSLSRLLAAGFHFSLLFLLLLDVDLAFLQLDFQRLPRTFAAGLSLIPAFLFIGGQYFKDSASPTSDGVPEKLRSAATLLFGLCLPAVIIVVRHDDAFNSLWKAPLYAHAFCILLFAFTFPEGHLGHLFGVFKDVMVSHWKATPNVQALSQGAQASLGRNSMYVDRETLARFQSAITCSKLEANVAASMLAANPTIKNTFARGDLSVMDIGGAEGRFIEQLIKALRAEFGVQSKFRKLHMIDPIPWEDEYKERLGKYVTSDIVVRRTDLMSLADDESFQPFDLVIASHSLYATADRANALGAAFELLTTRCAPGGSLLINLASAKSMSYRMKRKIFREHFDARINDLTAEHFEDILDEKAGTFSQNKKFVDNAIVVGGEDDVKTLDTMQILSYFLRLPLAANGPSNADDLESIRKRALDFCVPYECLPVKAAEQFSGSLPETSAPIGQGSLLLPHKTKVFVLSKPVPATP